MAVCDYCKQEMTTATGCTLLFYDDFPDGASRQRIPFGGEYGTMARDGERCHDCNALLGHLHHPGCDVEQCPYCEEQAAFCDCTSAEDEDEDDEGEGEGGGEEHDPEPPVPTPLEFSERQPDGSRFLLR